MTLRWYSTIIESTDPGRLGRWWAEALGWDVVFESGEEFVIIPPWAGELASRLPFEQTPPGIDFVLTDHEKTAKSPIHLDFAPHTSVDREAEIDRLIGLGAARVDVGQPADASWTVLVDIDGNEFCVLSSRDI